MFQNISRKKALKYMIGAAVAFPLTSRLYGCRAANLMNKEKDLYPNISSKYPFEVPALPYSYRSLEPIIDAQTMQIHYEKHHHGYAKKLNNALEKHPELHNISIFELFKRHSQFPLNLRKSIINHGGGYVNHILFWSIMQSPANTSVPQQLSQTLIKDFGSIARFKQQFIAQCNQMFGSGWVWLAKKNDVLVIYPTKNQNPPLLENYYPIMGIDLWEHAYYLKYQNRRAEYINNFWQVINWQQVENNFMSLYK